MESPTMLDMLRDMDKARMKRLTFAVAGHSNPSSYKKWIRRVSCIIHYSSIPEIFDLEIDHPD